MGYHYLIKESDTEGREVEAQSSQKLDSSNDYTYAGAVTESVQQAFAVLPSEAESADIGDAEARDHIAGRVGILVGEFIV